MVRFYSIKLPVLVLSLLSLVGCTGQNSLDDTVQAMPNMAAMQSPQADNVRGVIEANSSNIQVVGSRSRKQGRDMMMQTESLFQGALTLAPNQGNGDKTLIFKVTNKQSYPVPLTFNSGMTADLRIRSAQGKRLWAWSSQQMFTQAIRHTVLPAGKSLSVTFVIPASVMQKVDKGSVAQAMLMARATESRQPLLNEVKMMF